MSLISPVNRAVGAVIRGFHARITTPLRLRWLNKIYGLQHALEAIGHLPMAEIPDALRMFGATVGAKAHILPGIRFENAQGGLGNLHLGDNVYIGTGVLFDLTAPIRLENHAGIAPYACLITHLSVGDRPTQDSYPTVSGGVTLEEGCVVGTGVVILHGVTVGRNAAISAGSVVHRSIPPFTVMTGVPARYSGEIPDRRQEGTEAAEAATASAAKSAPEVHV